MESLLEESVAESEPSVDPCKVVCDLLWLAEQCEMRCMFEQSLWAVEQLNHLPDGHFSDCGEVPSSTALTLEGMEVRKRALVMFARTLITNKDYHRARFFLSERKTSSSLETFLFYYAWYQISMRNKFEDDAEDLEWKENCADNQLSELRSDLESLKQSSPGLFDCFLNFLLGLVRVKCDANESAIHALIEAIQQDNRCWPAWECLSTLVDGFYVVKIEKEPYSKTWLYNLFVAETMSRLALFVCAIEAYAAVSRHVGASPYILCQIAAAQSELQEHDSAINSFQKIRKSDPYRIEQMHFYSDSLYIRQNFTALASLAKWFYESHKFNWETCCIVANYYSAKNIHEQAQEFLKRSIKLCPTNASLWVLLGHEYLETKNHQAAASSYKKATVIDPNCYRGWYGLGQLNEIMKQPANALFFYQKAHKCRPDDSRMLIALGVIFSKLNRKPDAEKCFKKAFQIGDVEGNALIHLAKLYEEQEDSRNAAKAYEAYLTLYTEELVGDLNLIATSCRFLACYNLENGNLDIAYTYAQRCLNFDVSKEEGYRILRLIKSKRKEDQEKLGRAYNSTPQTAATHAGIVYRTPDDAQRPLGGGNDSSSMQTPKRREVDLAGNEASGGSGGGDVQEEGGEEGGEEDMNTNESDEDLEISF